ncbi:hypothetical protein [Pontitalea aquivivens]|uniref:hypothetical protein n=1 Tax=Pontitalea aquivivens TaxID=3388663 RepID=UPI003970ED33
MSDIAEYERRISFALERIGRGVDALAARPLTAPEPVAEPVAEVVAEAVTGPAALPQPDADSAAELVRLHAALEAERSANARLSDRVRAIRDKQETTLSALERRLAQASRALEVAEAEAARLKQANADLAAANRALLDAAERVEPHLVNRALQAELEGLRAARAAELAELNDILGTLEPILASAEAGAATAQEGADHG